MQPDLLLAASADNSNRWASNDVIMDALQIVQTGGPSDNDNADNSNRWATASNNQVLLPRLVHQATR